MTSKISLTDIQDARARIQSGIQPLRITESASLSELYNNEVLLAHEYLQTTGAFKLRGALNAILQLNKSAGYTGVTAVSTGNHGKGLAYAAKLSGIRCVICMSELVPENKVEGIRSLGAEIRIIGRSQDEAEVEVNRLVAEEGYCMLPPFDHPHIIAGQGTLGLEMLEQHPDLDTVVIQLSGGGLISGMALAIKLQKPDVRLIGVSMERGCAMIQSQKAGKPIEVEELPTLADSLGGGIGLDNQYTFDIVKQYVDDFVILNENEIADGIRHAYFKEQIIVEGSGSVCLGAMVANKIKPGRKTIVLLSGKNINMELHRKIINNEPYEL
ncbi:MAG: threonine dehydratase [Gammaproteobacteria bacterium]|jgi:threonine dehydratase